MSKFSATFLRSAAAAVLAFMAPASFAAHSIAPPRITAELMQMRPTPERIAISFWLSTAAFTDPAYGISPQQAASVTQALDGYELVGIQRARVDPTGSITSDDRAQLRSSARLRLDDGTVIAALSDDDMPPTVRAACDAIEPMMSKLLGKFGETLQMVVFRDADEHGHSRLDARKPGALTITFGGESFHWNLPLVSLLPLRIDSSTGDTFPGDYDFSPFTGNKLLVQP